VKCFEHLNKTLFFLLLNNGAVITGRSHLSVALLAIFYNYLSFVR